LIPDFARKAAVLRPENPLPITIAVFIFRVSTIY
jgi:hypothetical protein